MASINRVIGLIRNKGIEIAMGAQSTPNPTFEVLDDTVVETSVSAQRKTTDSNGQVSLDWSDRYAFNDKPTLSVQFEQGGGETPIGWFVDSYDTDGNGRFTGATIQLVDSSGAAIGNNAPVLAQLQGT